MTSYTFEAQPKVVKTHAKFKPDSAKGTSSALSTFTKLMQDNRIKTMNPVNQEQEYVRLEKERIKIENMQSQLLHFKKNKKKMTPYDIKPSPNPRIEVNLQFFLQDPNNLPAKTTVIDTQTDKFEQIEKEEVYIPKKTGIDASTQVEDTELFEFDREVGPIVNVIVTKTLEQSLLEIEQEDEMDNMKEYKKEYHKRRETEKESWKALLQKEIDRVKQKNKMLDYYRDRQKLKNKAFYTLQNHNMASNYLKNLKNETLGNLFAQGFYPNDSKTRLEVNLFDWLIDETNKEANSLKIAYDFAENAEGRNPLFNEFVVDLQEARRAVDLKRERTREKMRKRKFNDLNKDKKILKLFYKDPSTVPTFESRYFAKFIDGTMQEYETQKANELAALLEQFEKNEITEEDYNNIKRTRFPEYPKNNFSFYANSLKKIGFSLAHNMYYPTFLENRKFTMKCYFFDTTGKVLNILDRDIQPRIGKLAKYKQGIRDKKLKTSDDEIILINLDKLPPEIYSFLFVVELPDYNKVLQQVSDIEYARFSLTEPEYNILFDDSVILKDYKFEDISKELDLNIELNNIQVGILMPYYVSRSHGEWHIEFIKESKVFIGKEPEVFFESLPGFIGSCYEKNVEEETLKSKMKSEENEEEEENAKVSKKGEKSPHKRYLSQTQSLSVPSTQVGNPLTNRCFQNTILSIHDSVEAIYDKLLEGIQKEDPEILKTAEWGYEFTVHGKPFVRPTQIRKLKKLGELEFRKKKEPEPVKEIPMEGEQGEGDPNDMSPDHNDFKIDD